MECKECKIDMRVEKVENNIFTFKCGKCGKISTKTDIELETEYSKK